LLDPILPRFAEPDLVPRTFFFEKYKFFVIGNLHLCFISYCALLTINCLVRYYRALMGANEWRHTPTLEKMSNQTLTLYLTEGKASGNYYRLNKTKPTKTGFLEQTVNFADRETLNGAYYPWLIVGKPLDLSPGYLYVSEPFDEPVSINGTFAGEIKAVINKKDMDFNVTLYELMPDGKPFQLSYFIGRASYAGDMTVRRLLTPGKVESIPFDRTHMVSRRLSRGSRLLVAVDINKSPFEQINYGTGKDVSDEDIRDAQIPLKIKWRNDSYVKIPIWKQTGN
jgi:predicted acyl esterase